MSSNRLSGFSSAFDDLLERSFGTFQGQSTFGPDLLPVLTIQNIGSATIDGVEGGLSAGLPARGQLDLAASWRPCPRPARPRNARSTTSSARDGATRSWTGPAREANWSCGAGSLRPRAA